MYTVRNSSFKGGVYTDLACERRRVDPAEEGVKYKKEYAACGLWERIEITSRAGEKSIGRPMGFYDTLLLPRMDLCDERTVDDAVGEVASELISLAGKMRVVPERILVVGLGNSSLTPDSVGTEAAGGDKEKIVVVFSLERAKAILAEDLVQGDVVLFLNDLPDVY